MAFETLMTQVRGKTRRTDNIAYSNRSWIIYTLHIKYYVERQEIDRGVKRIISLTKCNSGTIQKLSVWS